MITATWQGNALVSDTGAPLALYEDGALTADGVRIEVTHSAGAMRWKVTGTSGEEDFAVRMRGLGVGALTARCGSRTYSLVRESALSKSRLLIDASGTPRATTTPTNGVDLAVAQTREIPFADLVFLTWALTLIDTPGRRTLQ